MTVNSGEKIIKVRLRGEHMFDFTDDMKEKAQIVREFCNEWILPNLEEIDEGMCCPDYIWDEWCKIPGFAAPCAPKHAGGPELPFTTCCAMWEELGRADLGCATAFGLNNLGSFPILLAGNEAQQKEHFGNLLQGKYGAFGLTEKGAGSDASKVATSAVKKGDKYILNGDKCYISQSGKAIDGGSTLAIVASTDRSLGSKGLTAFLVRGDSPGFSYTKEEDKMGIRGSQTCELLLENVEVDASRVLGQEGMGFKIAMMTLDAGRAIVAAQANGLTLAVIDELKRYCNTHIVNGRPLSKNKAVTFKIAEIEAACQVGRQYVFHTARKRDAGLRHSHESSIAKMYCTETAIKATKEALNIMGVNALKKGSLIEKLYRDARILSIYEGTNQIQRLVVAGDLFPKKKKK